MSTSPVVFRRFSGIYLCGGQVRRVSFEAADLEDAKRQAAKWNVGVDGEETDRGPIKSSLPIAYNLQETKRLLGGVSRATVYRLLNGGVLRRIANIEGRLLITRASIEGCARENG